MAHNFWLPWVLCGSHCLRVEAIFLPECHRARGGRDGRAGARAGCCRCPRLGTQCVARAGVLRRPAEVGFDLGWIMQDPSCTLSVYALSECACHGAPGRLRPRPACWLLCCCCPELGAWRVAGAEVLGWPAEVGLCCVMIMRGAFLEAG